MRISLHDGRLCNEDLTLRPPKLSDVADITRSIDDDEIRRWLPDIANPYTEADGQEWVLDSMRHWRRADPPHAPMVLLIQDRFAGTLGLVNADHANLVVEAGYWVAEWARGHGLATRGLLLLTHWAFEWVGAVRIQLHIQVGNLASEKVASHAGFVHEGVRHRVKKLGDDHVDMGVWATWR